ncbi:DNA-binding protein [Jiella endophytica]|uniref:DNA-binding protein n=1 Tax=Jiella endophytica TaxID=2558362 RepID=A0A4Y8RVI5_9HYPH|nr:DNA-binding protein [Jiella endophytica]TFF27531.1 DNA-binding protein [Jiella endophytica]
MTIDEALRRPTISVPDAGSVFYGLGRCASYEAARRGDIPTIKIGGRLLVPVVSLAEKVGLKARIGDAA